MIKVMRKELMCRDIVLAKVGSTVFMLFSTLGTQAVEFVIVIDNTFPSLSHAGLESVLNQNHMECFDRYFIASNNTTVCKCASSPHKNTFHAHGMLLCNCVLI